MLGYFKREKKNKKKTFLTGKRQKANTPALRARLFLCVAGEHTGSCVPVEVWRSFWAPPDSQLYRCPLKTWVAHFAVRKAYGGYGVSPRTGAPGVPTTDPTKGENLILRPSASRRGPSFY